MRNHLHRVVLYSVVPREEPVLVKNSQKKLVQGGALDARKKLGEKVNSPGPGPILSSVVGGS
mgnify:CR=1 FL=1